MLTVQIDQKIKIIKIKHCVLVNINILSVSFRYYVACTFKNIFVSTLILYLQLVLIFNATNTCILTKFEQSIPEKKPSITFKLMLLLLLFTKSKCPKSDSCGTPKICFLYALLVD